MTETTTPPKPPLPFTPIPGATPTSGVIFFLMAIVLVVLSLFLGPFGTALMVLGTSVWVAVDAGTHKLDQYRNGIGGRGTAFLGSLLLWIVVFPWYLAVRSRIRAGVEPMKTVGPAPNEELHEASSFADSPAQAPPRTFAPFTRLLIGLGITGVLVIFVIVFLSSPSPRARAGRTAALPSAPQSTSPPVSDTTRPAVPQRAPESNLTSVQRNAARSAESYLQFSGFSRQGLIGQLSSEFGDKFSVGDATAAVDSLSIDWNTQAARSAASYLKMSGFSCQGLIDQLSSQHGDKYTVTQATYGATQAGIC